MTTAPPSLNRPPLLPSPQQEGTARWLWWLAGGALAGLVVLYLFNPVEHTFYPACQFYQLTALHCPGCGSLRALHQLTHGHVGAAFDSNPLLIVSLPFLAGWGFRNRRAAPHRAADSSWIQPRGVWFVFGILLAFAILRNLPWKVFAWMSP